MTGKRPKPVERAAARLGAVQALYQMDLAGTDVGETLAQFSARASGENFDDGQCGEADYKFLKEVVDGAVREQATIDPAVDAILDKFCLRRNHAFELHFSSRQRHPVARLAEPAKIKAGKLPHRIEPETSRHDRIANEMAGKEPEIRLDIELGADIALVVSAACLGHIGDAVKHQHRRGGKLRIARPEHLAAPTRKQFLVSVA